MRRREFIGLVGGVVVWPAVGGAQRQTKSRKLGLLSASGGGTLEAVFPSAARELGWVEGQNIVLERRYAGNRLDRLPEMAAELVSLNVDLIVSGGILASLAAKRATSTIPIVSVAGDPVGSGLVASLARPGGNVTGLSLMTSDVGGKRIELLREIVPHAMTIAVLWNGAAPQAAQAFHEAQEAVRSLKVELRSFDVRKPADIDSVFKSAASRPPDALITVEDPLTQDNRKQITDLAALYRWPAIYGTREFVEVGGLVSYGVSIPDLFRRAAAYVDKILKGAKPSDLAVEQPTKFELVINLKAAKALGLTIPPTLLARADEVIE